MATADQIKSLIRSYNVDDKEKFYSVALQVAAHEAKRGHASLAHEIRGMVDSRRKEEKQSLKVVSFPSELKGLIHPQEPSTPKSALEIKSLMNIFNGESFMHMGFRTDESFYLLALLVQERL